jgi:hypothetical protein
MKTRHPWLAALSVACAALASAAVPAADPPAPAPAALVVIDAAGKEHRLKTWQFVSGTRRLAWLAPAAPAREGDKPPPAGPEALEFRDDNSTTFVEGIVTLIPLEHLRSLEYDAAKETVSAHVFNGPKVAPEDDVLTGTTKYKGINKVTIEAEIDKGELGVAEVKFLGGSPKGVRAVRFPVPKPTEHPAGPVAAVTVADREAKNVQKVNDLRPLYRTADGGERLLPTLTFKKTLKLDVGKLKKLQAAEGGDRDGGSWTVTLKDGEEQTLTLLKEMPLDGKPAALEGLLGKVRGGYKLFPMHTIAQAEFDVDKDDGKP